MEKHLNTAELVAVTLFSASPIGAVRCFTFPPLKGGKVKTDLECPQRQFFTFSQFYDWPEKPKTALLWGNDEAIEYGIIG